MATQVQSQLTVEEYLEQERQAEVRSEYLDGETFLMAEASVAHNQIVGNLLVALRDRFHSQGCGVWATDLRVRVEATGFHAYPDVVAICDEPRLVEDGHLDTLINPQLIFESLSPSTEG